MSVSSHLTPEPERRLWLILEHTRHSIEIADVRVAALTALAAAELAFLARGSVAVGPARGVELLLALSLPFGVFAFSAVKGTPDALNFLAPRGRRPSGDDNLVRVEDLAKYTHGELIHRLDKYLGGGITATPYYEDLIGQIVYCARVGARKQALFLVDCLLVGAAQTLLLAQFLLR